MSTLVQLDVQFTSGHTSTYTVRPALAAELLCEAHTYSDVLTIQVRTAGAPAMRDVQDTGEVSDLVAGAAAGVS